MSETSTDELIARSQQLPSIPPAAAKAYAGKIPRLVLAVNERIQAHPRYPAWLGGQPARMLADNHRHHALFMDEVLSAGAFDLLAVTLPWVYHAYHAQGVSYDYFEVELQAWKHAVSALLDSDHAASINAVYDWMLAQHATVITLAEAREAPRNLVAAGFEDLF